MTTIMELTNWRLEDLEYNPSLLRRVEAVIKYYTGNGYETINHAFQYNIRPEVQNTFLAYALKLAVYTHNEIILYRGCGESETNTLLNAIEDGIYVLDYDFPTSCSLLLDVATRFSDEISRFSTEHSAYVGYSALLAIRVPAETPVIYASALSAWMDEYEVILPPRTRLYIEDVEKTFNEKELSFALTIHTRAEVDLREVEEDYVDEHLISHWAYRSGVDLEANLGDDNEPEE